MAKRDLNSEFSKMFGISLDEWKKLDKKTQDLITSNMKLWKDFGNVLDDSTEKAKAFTGHTKQTVAKWQEFRDISKDIKKSYKDIFKGGEKLESVTLGLNSSWLTYGKLLKLNTKEAKKKLKVIDDMSQTYQDVAANALAVGTDEFQNLNIAKQIRVAKQQGMTNEVEQLKILQVEQKLLEKIHKEAVAGAESIVKPVQSLDSMLKKIPGGEFLSNILGLDGIAKTIKDQYLEGVADAAVGMVGGELLTKSGKPDGRTTAKSRKDRANQLSWGQKMGQKWGALTKQQKLGVGFTGAIALSVGKMALSAFNFSREIGMSGKQIGALGPFVMFIKDETKAIVDEFGTLEGINTRNLVRMKMMSFWTGVQSKDTAKILMLQKSISGLNTTDALKQQSRWQKEIMKDGLSASKVMADIASSADFFAMYSKEGGENMKDAAKYTAKMGLDLSAAEGMANKLLDWESSIAAEMEASMILGRQISLDRARELAYTGKIEEMMREVKNQVGGEAEFARMTVVQRQALGDAIGLQGDKLSKFMTDQADANKEVGKSFVGWGIAIGALLGLLIAIKGTIASLWTGGIKAIGGYRDLARGAALMGGGALLGGTIGGLASFQKPGTVTEGGLAKVDRGDVYTGEGGFDLTPMTTEQKETNSLMKGMMAQNQHLMDKLNRTTEGLGYN